MDPVAIQNLIILLGSCWTIQNPFMICFQPVGVKLGGTERFFWVNANNNPKFVNIDIDQFGQNWSGWLEGEWMGLPQKPPRLNLFKERNLLRDIGWMGCWVDGWAVGGWAAAGGHIKPKATTMCLDRKLEVNGRVVESVVVDQPVVSPIYHQNMCQNNILRAAVCLLLFASQVRPLRSYSVVSQVIWQWVWWWPCFFAETKRSKWPMGSSLGKSPKITIRFRDPIWLIGRVFGFKAEICGLCLTRHGASSGWWRAIYSHEARQYGNDPWWSAFGNSS